jgi:uncharacterized protein
MPLEDDQSVADILNTVHQIAVLGASPNPARPSYRVMEFLLSHGYSVTPVNPGLGGAEILGQKVYPSLAAIPHSIDMVDVFRNAAHLPNIVDQVITAEIEILWTQLDVIDTQAAQRAEASGIRVVMDRCPAIEWPRLHRAAYINTTQSTDIIQS